MGRMIDVTVYLSSVLGLLASIYLVLAAVIAFPAQPSGFAPLLAGVVTFGLFPVVLLFLLRVKFVDYFRVRRPVHPESRGLRSRSARALGFLWRAVDRVALLVRLFLELSDEDDKRLAKLTDVGRCPPWMRTAAIVLQVVGAVVFFGYGALEVLHYLPPSNGAFFPAPVSGGFGLLCYATVFTRFYAANALASRQAG